MPLTSNNIYVADYAHILESKHNDHRNRYPLNLCYNCENGHEATQAYVHSYIRINVYARNHISPVVQVLRVCKGLTVPTAHIKIMHHVERG